MQLLDSSRSIPDVALSIKLSDDVDDDDDDGDLSDGNVETSR
jgi:hypothetical protein